MQRCSRPLADLQRYCIFRLTEKGSLIPVNHKNNKQYEEVQGDVCGDRRALNNTRFSEGSIHVHVVRCPI